jgi:type IV secretory pathway VirB6-like protein
LIVEALFPTYRFDRADSDDFMVIDEWSYALAAFTGPLFVLSKRLYLLAFIDLLVMMLLAGGVIFGLTIIVYLFSASLEGMLLMLITVVGGVALNGIVAVRLVRHGYLRRGWRLGY